MHDNLVSELLAIIKKVQQTQKVDNLGLPSWDGSRLEEIRNLQIDVRGMVGELFVARCLSAIGYKTRRDEKTRSIEKGYDILVDGHFKVEVKTATRGKNSQMFQHENLSQERDYDAIILLDIAPEQLFMTCGRISDLPFRVASKKFTKTKKKMHLRNKGGAYKWDFSIEDVKNREIKTLDDFRRLFDSVYKADG